MTLLVNEIFIRKSDDKSAIVFAADRRITAGGRFHSERKKIFPIPYINAGIGYFGLAQLTRNTFLSEWIPEFIENHVELHSIHDFAKALQSDLNQQVNKGFLRQNPSGLHICGYNEDKHPELWFVRNIQTMEGPRYSGFSDHYTVTEDFNGRDRLKMERQIELEGSSGEYNQYYVNGDIRGFHSLWILLEYALMKMLKEPDFHSIAQRSDLLKSAKFKMETISLLYEEFASSQIIGEPIDTFLLTPEGSAGYEPVGKTLT